MSPLHSRGARIWLLVIAAAAACSKPPSTPSTVRGDSRPTITITGTVRDLLLSGNTGAPVPGVRVEAIYSSRPSTATLSDADGTFRLENVVSGESIQLRASKPGYEPSERTMLPGGSVHADITLTPIRSTLTGVVMESAPAGALPVAGARIEIISGSHTGMVTTTDANGNYALRDIWGEFDVSVSSPNHETATAQASLGTNSRLDVQLVPRAIRTRITFTGELCTVERRPPWLQCSAPFERSHLARVNHPGPTSVMVDYEYVGDYYPNYLTVEMRCGSAVVFEKRIWKLGGIDRPLILPDNVRGAVQLTLNQPCEYDFRVFNFVADTKGGVQTKYRIDVDHP